MCLPALEACLPLSGARPWWCDGGLWEASPQLTFHGAGSSLVAQHVACGSSISEFQGWPLFIASGLHKPYSTEEGKKESKNKNTHGIHTKKKNHGQKKPRQMEAALKRQEHPRHSQTDSMEINLPFWRPMIFCHYFQEVFCRRCSTCRCVFDAFVERWRGSGCPRLIPLPPWTCPPKHV